MYDLILTKSWNKRGHATFTNRHAAACFGRTIYAALVCERPCGP